MTIFLVTSIRNGATITTRHFLPTAVETEKLRRALAGDSGITVQEVPQAAATAWSCTKRGHQQRTQRNHRGGCHV